MVAAILNRYAVEDIAVEDPPLEEVIAKVFAHSDWELPPTDTHWNLTPWMKWRLLSRRLPVRCAQSSDRRKLMLGCAAPRLRIGTYRSARWSLHRVTCWWTILRIALEERLVYRGDFALGTLMRFLPIVTQIFLWLAIFDAIRAESRQRPHDRGLSVSRRRGLLSAVDGHAGLLQHARSGFRHRSADSRRRDQEVPGATGGFSGVSVAQPHRPQAAYYSVAILPFALVFFLCRGFFVDGWPAWRVMVGFLLSLVMAFLLGFFWRPPSA